MQRDNGGKSVGRMFLSSPLLVVLSVATAVVFAMSLAGYVRRGGFWSPEVDAHVFNENGSVQRQEGVGSSNQQRAFAFQGEVYDQVEQVRESAALAMGTTLLAVHGVLERKPFATVESLLAGVVAGGLAPPGLSQDSGNAAMSSAQAVYYIRYRAEPLGVEVLSIGKGKGSGLAIVVRLPDDGFSENALTYYMLSKAGAQMPAAFTPTPQLMVAGWQPVTFKASEVSGSERELQRQWLAARAALPAR